MWHKFALTWGSPIYIYIYIYIYRKAQRILKFCINAKKWNNYNSKYRLCGDRDETINHTSECSKLAQKSIRLDSIVLGRCSTGNCARNWNLTILNQIVYEQTRICPGEWEVQTSLGFRDINRSLNFGQTTRLNDNQQKKESFRIVDNAVPADHRVKKNEKSNRYLDLAS